MRWEHGRGGVWLRVEWRLSLWITSKSTIINHTRHSHASFIPIHTHPPLRSVVCVWVKEGGTSVVSERLIERNERRRTTHAGFIRFIQPARVARYSHDTNEGNEWGKNGKDERDARGPYTLPPPEAVERSEAPATRWDGWMTLRTRNHGCRLRWGLTVYLSLHIHPSTASVGRKWKGKESQRSEWL